MKVKYFILTCMGYCIQQLATLSLSMFKCFMIPLYIHVVIQMLHCNRDLSVNFNLCVLVIFIRDGWMTEFDITFALVRPYRQAGTTVMR